ncbi:hypothetical protein [Paenibacillus sp. UNC451MF]|uniref:hypothetical protein n=1 Tax=Paenibacillus sp. UNC451MF TaxID=1449063 RepID=UPI0012DD7FE9|nr:hypothetical protein [Paenibacillus sp. UNC451MF]
MCILQRGVIIGQLSREMAGESLPLVLMKNYMAAAATGETCEEHVVTLPQGCTE